MFCNRIYNLTIEESIKYINIHLLDTSFFFELLKKQLMQNWIC